MTAEQPAPRLPAIEQLNRLDESAFADALRLLFESALHLVTALSKERPFASYDDLLDRAAALVADLPEEQKVEIVNAHPRIGEDPAAVRRTSALSYREQGYDREAGLDQRQVEQVYRNLDALNQTYEARFGFRFVVFVDGRPKAEIVDVMRARLENPRQEELSTALRDMLLIARDRLRSLTAF
jgi:OHCU decarboxylase